QCKTYFVRTHKPQNARNLNLGTGEQRSEIRTTHSRIQFPSRSSGASVGAGVGFDASSWLISSRISALSSTDDLSPNSVAYNESTRHRFNSSSLSSDGTGVPFLDRYSAPPGPHPIRLHPWEDPPAMTPRLPAPLFLPTRW
ncbi:unnamed protein product, partial [Musa acuminata subsp. burmannicoides]